MARALDEARRILGQAWPNPAVGCVIVRDEVIVGRGHTQAGGRPHAETQALAQAGTAAFGATAYVTLEPCSHHGQTGPCAQALIDAGIARIVSALEDPNPLVSGQGHQMLREAGVAVEVGVLAEEAARLNQGFILTMTQGRPRVMLKIATSLDGRIATARGESKWITGPLARERSHLGRAMTDAIMVGSSTAVIDDPDLTCRLEGHEHRQPVRVVADGRLRLPLTAKMVRTAREVPTFVLTLPDSDAGRRRTLSDAGVEIFVLEPGPDRRLAPLTMLKALAGRGITRLMVEGGAKLAAAFLAADLVDVIAWYRAPILIGGDGVPALGPLGLSRLDDAKRFHRRSVEPLGQDLLEVYEHIA